MNKDGWKIRNWYYTKAEAEKIAASLKRDGRETKIKRARNLHYPEEGGKHRYDLYFKIKEPKRQAPKVSRGKSLGITPRRPSIR